MNLKGSKVKHPLFGEGIVLDSFYNDFELLVEFENKKKFRVRLDEIEFLNQLQTEGETNIKQININKPRRIIEALRLGVVPLDCIEDFTFGRDREILQINQWLLDINNPTKLIIGEYGSGKTHFINFLAQFALKNGFAVSILTIDPFETPFYKPKQIYKHLILNFRYFDKTKNQICSFRDFLNGIFKKFDFYDNLYFKFLKNKLDKEEVLEWIEGLGGIKPYKYITDYYYVSKSFPPLYDYSTTINLYCYLISTIGWATKLIDLEGLLVIFDEVENKKIFFNTRQSQITDFFLLGIYFISKNQNNFKELIKDSWISKGIQNVPFIYKSPCNLKLIFSSTQFSNNDILSIFDKNPLNLEPLEEDVFKDLYNAISTFYTQSYSFNHLPDFETLVDFIQSKTEFPNFPTKHTRLFVKYIIELFDLIRFNIISF